jgi:hypothetical protein
MTTTMADFHTMDWEHLKAHARALGIKTGRRRRADLIEEIEATMVPPEPDPMFEVIKPLRNHETHIVLDGKLIAVFHGIHRDIRKNMPEYLPMEEYAKVACDELNRKFQ